MSSARISATSSESARSTRSVSRRIESSACFSRLLSSTSACGSMKSVVPEADASCTMPGTRARESERTGST